MRNREDGTIRWVAMVVALALGATFVCFFLLGEAPAEEAKETYAKKEKPDPVATNGAIFVDWPKPDVALVFTGEQNGYLEPCGCAGLENQKGGLRRRFTFLNELRMKGWPIVAMDLGGQEQRFGKQAEIKFDFALRALALMGYSAVGFGPQDLRMDLPSIIINIDEKSNPLVSANVGIIDFESGLAKRYAIVEAGGLKIGITTVLGKSEMSQLKNLTEIKLLDPQQAIPEILPKLLEAKCDHLVLLVFATPEEAKELARRYKDFDWVVTARGAEEPPKTPTPISGTNAQLVEVGHKGMYAGVVGFYKGGSPPARYQRVPLDHRFADAPEISAMHEEYQKRLQTLGLEGLGLKTVATPSGKKFAGSQVCGDCHTKAMEVFNNTPHSHATETLVNLDPPRHFDPECLSCHVTGWEPQKYFPFESGFLGLNETPGLVGNGCENCHGPAARHAAVEAGEIDVDQKEREKLREALRLKIVENEGNKPGQVFDKGKVVQMCMECHDLDNSPAFDFQTYWPKVKHEGKD